MKVARFHPVRPVQTISELFGTTGSGPSGQVLTATGSNSSSVAWGSNVATITSNGSNVLVGPYVGLQSGSGIAFAASSNILTISATGGGGGGASVSFGSNATRVSEVSSAGASTDSARADHIHDGIGTITASSSNTMQRGTWNLRAGSGIALSLTDTDGDGEFDTTTIVNTGSGGGGGGGSSTAYDPIANNFGTPDTTFEFDTSSFTGLTALSPTPDGEDANTSVVSHYYIKDNDSEFVGRYASVSPPFTAITKLSDATLRANYSHAGLFCGVATPGKMVSVLARFGDGQFVLTFTQTGPTDTGPGTPSVTDPPATPLAYPMYLGIKCVSSTDVSYYMSHTGHVWHAILLNHNNTMTVASVGIGIFILGGGTGQTSAAFDYLRIWNSSKTFVL